MNTTSKDFDSFSKFLDYVVTNHGSNVDLFKIAGEQGNDGLILEFGVASGATIKTINDCYGGARPVHGFDWFQGLPEDWRSNYEAGAFKCDKPEVPENITLHVGLFQDTLDEFLANNPGHISLLHLDADLYSSTAFVLERLEDRLVEGSFVYFDELTYPASDWRDHEYAAFVEHHERTGLHYEFIGRRNPEAYGFKVI